MILKREMFLTLKDEIKNEVCCSIPNDCNITEIDSYAFCDWESLQYVYIPNNILLVKKDAFNWNKIKIIFADIETTTFEDVLDNVSILPICGNEYSLFMMLKEVLEIKKQLNFDPNIIMEKDKKLNDMLKKYLENSNLREGKINKEQKILQEKINMLEDYKQQSNNIIEGILNKIQETIDIMSNKKIEEIKLVYLSIKNQLEELKFIFEKCNDIKEMLENVQKNIIKELDQYKIEIINNFNLEYEQRKNIIIDKIIKDATEKLIEKNPYKNLIININDVKKNFLPKELFHKDFQKVLQLVYSKKPILLKGPAGSGKNVIIEQIAKALNLQFYYCNDVTDEYKIMGFVDANGKFIETQFFKAFTNGGIMFIDEIDNSNPSALLAINAAIGTGYNHYMAFPDGNFYQAHKDFHLVAAANTFGTGADMIYSGRQALDGASLNRFIPVVIDYDKELERNLINHKEILELYWQVRNIIQDNTIRHVISTRNIKNASDLLDMNCFNLNDIFEWTIVQGLDQNDLSIISARIITNDLYSRKFLEYIKDKYQLESKKVENSYQDRRYQRNHNFNDEFYNEDDQEEEKFYARYGR